MNKYQVYALRNSGYGVWKDEKFNSDSRMDKTDSNSSWSCILDTDNKIVINQDENYNITKYYVRFPATVEKVVVGDNVFSLQPSENPKYKFVTVPVDFNNQIKEMELHFNGVIDPLKVPVEYKAIDRNIYDSKLENERQSDLASKSNIKVSTGEALVNIYFQPCNDNYSKTVIELYLAVGKYPPAPTVMGRGMKYRPALLSATPGQMIGKYNVEEGMMFKSITGLAKGAYGFKLSQYDNKGNLLFTTDFQYFQIY